MPELSANGHNHDFAAKNIGGSGCQSLLDLEMDLEKPQGVFYSDSLQLLLINSFIKPDFPRRQQ